MACRWQPGMKITALLDALNSALAEPFALAWSQDSPRFLLVFTVIYAVVVIVAVTDQKNTRPGAEHGSAAWGDVFRLNKFYMDKRGPNLLLTQHFHIGIDGYKHKHNTNILIVGGSGAGKTRTYGVPNVLECACSMVITDPKSEILRKTGNLLKQKGYPGRERRLEEPPGGHHRLERQRECGDLAGGMGGLYQPGIGGRRSSRPGRPPQLQAPGH